MSATDFPLNHPLAVQLWSASLAKEAEKKQYLRRFVGTGNENCLMALQDLNKKPGEKITFGLRMKLTGYGIEGDNTIEGTSAEEALSFFNDALYVDQLRKGTKSKGKMSEQRVPYDLRKEGRDALATWWAEIYDEKGFVYLSGARGINSDFKLPLGYTGFANNAIEAPDSDHIVYPGTATSSTTIAAANVMALAAVEKIMAKAKTTDPMIQPLMFEGNQKFVLVMHTFQAYSLRTNTTTNDWVDIQKNAGERGKNNLVYKDALGEYSGVILHEHRNVIRFDTYGTTGDLPAARALFLGAQAGVTAWAGNGGPGRYSWNEETDDRGNALAITAGAIFGVKKCRFDSKDFGVIALDTYAANPNA